MKLTVVYARDSSEWQNDQSIKGQLNMLLDTEHVPPVAPHLDGWANVIFQPLCKPIYVFHKSSKTGNFFQMAPWRVLGIDECGGASRRHSQAHATEKQQDWHEKPKRKHGGAEPSPLTRLGIGSVFPAAHSFLSLVLYPFYIPLEFCLFRSAMVA